jgi:hypothetical protein
MFITNSLIRYALSHISELNIKYDNQIYVMWSQNSNWSQCFDIQYLLCPIVMFFVTKFVGYVLHFYETAFHPHEP